MPLPPVPTHASTAAADAWLAAADAIDGDATWQASGRQFQQAVTAAAWSEQLLAARRPLGTLSGRQLAVAQDFAALPGAPPGQYAILQYHAVYDGRQATVETVTLEHEGDGAWRVVGYFIR